MLARFIALTAAIFVLVSVGYQQITAQNLVTCPGLVRAAIDSVGNNCGSLERNSACYGFNDVVANFSLPQPADYFSRPSDRARLLDLQDLNTSPMDQSNQRWGIALLSVQANLPDTLPGQSVIFMLLGDTQVENAVPADQAFQSGATVSVTLQIGADQYFLPDFSQQVLGSIPQGTSLVADAISEDGQWVRVVYQSIPGWVTRQVIASDADLSTLPVIGPETKTPMQAFYFRTSISGTNCTEAPNALVVQGPENVTVDINANGADIRLGSTIVLYLLAVDVTTQQTLGALYGDIGVITQLMQIIVLDGHVVLNEGTPDEVVLEAGETTFRCLAAPDDLGEDGQPNDREIFNGCPWSPPQLVTEEDVARFRELEGITLNYPIDLPIELPTLTPTPSNTPRPSGGVFLPTATFTPTFTPTFTQAPQQEQPPPPVPTETPSCPVVPSPANDVPTLIAAINAANQCPDVNTIDLAGTGFYLFDAIYPGGDNLNVLPVIASPIIINGNGSTIASSGEFNRRYFYIGAGGDLTLNSMVIQNGYNPGAEGGAIYNAGKVALNFVSVNSNTAGNGGGIYNGGTLTIFSSSLSSDGEGGNFSTNGGGLYNVGTASINKSTLSYNHASGNGGGIYNTGALSLLNSTVSSNNATVNGFGLTNAGGTTTLNFTTLYENNGDVGASVEASGGSVTAKNSLIGGYTTDCSGTVSVQGMNYQDDGTNTCGIGFYYEISLGLSPLNNNGGSTRTNALDINSPAVDGGDCTTIDSTIIGDDQRGITRPQDNTGSGMGTCDAGSFELIAGGE